MENLTPQDIDNFYQTVMDIVRMAKADNPEWKTELEKLKSQMKNYPELQKRFEDLFKK